MIETIASIAAAVAAAVGVWFEVKRHRARLTCTPVELGGGGHRALVISNVGTSPIRDLVLKNPPNIEDDKIEVVADDDFFPVNRLDGGQSVNYEYYSFNETPDNEHLFVFRYRSGLFRIKKKIAVRLV